MDRYLVGFVTHVVAEILGDPSDKLTIRLAPLVEEQLQEHVVGEGVDQARDPLRPAATLTPRPGSSGDRAAAF